MCHAEIRYVFHMRMHAYFVINFVIVAQHVKRLRAQIDRLPRMKCPPFAFKEADVKIFKYSQLNSVGMQLGSST